jgi:hypothetical protein
VPEREIVARVKTNAREAPQKQLAKKIFINKILRVFFRFDDEEVGAGSSNHKSKRVQVQKHQISYEHLG